MKSQFSRVSRLSPRPSDPMTSASGAGQVGLEDRLFAVLRGAPDPEPSLFHVAQAPREVRHLRERNGLGRTGRDLAHDRRQARRAIARRDDGRRPGGVGGAQASAEVVRIGHAVEHQHERGRPLGRQQVEQRVLVERHARAHFGDDALVGRPARLGVERRRRRRGGLHALPGRELAQLPHAHVVAGGGDRQPHHVVRPARSRTARTACRP